MPILVARFIATYGAATFDNGNIGWSWFWLLYGEIYQLEAMQRVNMTTAVSLGAGMVLGGEPIARNAERDRIAAYNYEE